jgi:hypothetical protein
VSLESITDATARVIGEVPGMKAAYAPNVLGYPGVKPVASDVTDTPVAFIWYDHFELIKTGSFEVMYHFVTVDLYFQATTGAQAEAAMLPMVTLAAAAFRQRVGLYGQATVAKVIRGGPPRPESVNNKPFTVFPLTVQVTYGSVQDYGLGPPA